MHSALNVDRSGLAATRPFLRTGRVATPADPVDDPEGFRLYKERCLRMWSVDVQLDNGEYLVGCRILGEQTNSREGTRRMPQFPMATGEGKVIPGDNVVVGFLNGSVMAPVVLGGLSPMGMPRTSLSEAEGAHMSVREDNEWQDRHDVVDLSDPNEPLHAHTNERNTGLNIEREHVTKTLVDGEARRAHTLDRVRNARSIEREHLVEGEAGRVAVTRESNEEATNIETHHIVQTVDGANAVSIQDLEARVLQLTQTVSGLCNLLLRSEGAEKLLAQQDTPDMLVTLLTDSEEQLLSLMQRDKAEETQGGFTVGPRSVVSIRRADDGSAESYVALTDDGGVLARSSSGATVYVGLEDILVTSRTASISVSEANGIGITTTGGTMVSLTDDAAVVTSPAVSVNSDQIHLNAGMVRTGATGAGQHGVPSAEVLYGKLLQVETALARLYTWAGSHSHRFIGTSAGTPGTTMAPTGRPGTAPTGLFNAGAARTDSLKSLRGD